MFEALSFMLGFCAKLINFLFTFPIIKGQNITLGTVTITLFFIIFVVKFIFLPWYNQNH